MPHPGRLRSVLRIVGIVLAVVVASAVMVAGYYRLQGHVLCNRMAERLDVPAERLYHLGNLWQVCSEAGQIEASIITEQGLNVAYVDFKDACAEAFLKQEDGCAADEEVVATGRKFIARYWGENLHSIIHQRTGTCGGGGCMEVIYKSNATGGFYKLDFARIACKIAVIKHSELPFPEP